MLNMKKKRFIVPLRHITLKLFIYIEVDEFLKRSTFLILSICLSIRSEPNVYSKVGLTDGQSGQIF